MLLQHAFQSPQDRERQNDSAVLRLFEITAEQVGKRSDICGGLREISGHESLRELQEPASPDDKLCSLKIRRDLFTEASLRNMGSLGLALRKPRSSKTPPIAD